ncbi:hypothetical protein D3C84_1099660 [compost metagenome]
MIFLHLAINLKQAIQRVGWDLVDFLDDLGGGWVLPAHGIGQLLFVFGIQGDAFLLTGSLECVVKAIEIVMLLSADADL